MLSNVVEYPFTGVIKRNTGSDPILGTEGTSTIIYSGEMDYGVNTAKTGNIAQTSDCIVSMPLIKDNGGNYILPKKEDIITVNVFGDVFDATIVNYEVSQLGGITVYVTRGGWS
jgi:hypothetical protein